MATWLKRLLIGMTVGLVLIAALLTGVAYYIATPGFRQAIVTRLEKKIGGELALEDLSLYPTPIVRLALKGVHWKHAEKGIKADIARLVFKIPAHQLLLGKGPIEATLDLKLPVIELTQATFQAPDAGPAPAAPDGEGAQLTEKQSSVLQRLTISNVQIEDGTFVDRRDPSRPLTLDHIQLSVGPLSLQGAAAQRVDVDFECESSQEPVKGQIALKGAVGVDLGQGVIDLSDLRISLFDETFSLSGKVTHFSRDNPDQAEIDVALQNKAMNLGKWLALRAKPAEKGEEKTDIEGTLALELALSGKVAELKSIPETKLIPNAVAMRLSLDFSGLKIKGETLEKGHAVLTVKEGVLSVDPFQIQAYGGSFSGGATVTNLASLPHLSLAIKAQSFDPRALPLPNIQDKLKGLQGPVDAEFKLEGEGKDPETLKRSLSGSGTVDLQSFAIPEKKLNLSKIHAVLAVRGGHLELEPLSIDSVQVQEPPLVVQNVTLSGTIEADNVRIRELTSHIFGGKLSIQGDLLNLRAVPTFNIKASGSGLDLSQLPPPPDKKAGDYKIGGMARFDIQASGSGSTPEVMQKALDATGNFFVSDMPLPKMDVSSKMDKMGGRGGALAKLAPQVTQKREALKVQIEKIVAVQKLESLSGHITYRAKNIALSDTVAKNVNYEVRLGGTASASRELDMAGDIYITKERTDELVKTLSLASALQEADGRMRIPFAVTGSLDHPKMSLNMSEIMQKIGGEIREQIRQGQPAQKIQERIQQGGGPGKILRGIFGQ